MGERASHFHEPVDPLADPMDGNQKAGPASSPSRAPSRPPFPPRLFNGENPWSDATLTPNPAPTNTYSAQSAAGGEGAAPGRVPLGADLSPLRFHDFSPRNRGVERVDLSDEFLREARERLERDGLLPQRVRLDDVTVRAEEAGLFGATTVRRFIRTQILSWDRALKDAPFEIVRRELAGSLATGTFWGPKDAKLAESEFCPPHIERIIECDLHYFLGTDVDPHAEEVVSYFEKAFGARRFSEGEFVSGWGLKAPLQRLFLYADIGNNTAVEFEIALAQWDKVPEISNYWKRVFTDKEITWQSELRAALRAWRVEPEVMWDEKTHECDECRWRMVSAYALKTLLAEGQLKMRDPEEQRSLERAIGASFRGAPNPLVEQRVQEWLRGARGKGGLDRPPGIMSTKARVYMEAFCPEKLKSPVAPFWVDIAATVQEDIRARIEGNPSNLGHPHGDQARPSGPSSGLGRQDLTDMHSAAS